jgi:hypothetical protein
VQWGHEDGIGEAKEVSRDGIRQEALEEGQSSSIWGQENGTDAKQRIEL